MARILTLTNWYPPHAFGGYEVICQDVMTGLSDLGHQVEVLCSTERRAATTQPEGDIAVQRALRMYWRDDVPWTPPLRTQLAIERNNHRVLEATLDRFRPDVISVWHMGALSLSLLTSLERRAIPMVFAVADDWPTYALALDPWSRRWNSAGPGGALATLVRSFTRTPTTLIDIGRAGCFCFISEVNKQRCLESSPWAFPLAPIIHAGIDRRLYRAEPEPPPWQWRLLYVGRLDPRKGTHTLLRALASLPAATLTLCSQTQGEERSRHGALATELGVADRVHFVSAEHEEIAAIYAAHDAVLFSSEWPEPFGLVPLEAMASGTPVVATGVGGSAEFLIDGGNCVLYAPGDPAALAAAVARVAGDDGLRHRLRQHGLVTAASFDMADTVAAFDRCHRAAAEGRLTVDTVDALAHVGGPAS